MIGLTIDPGFDRDPLRPKKHHVIASTNGKDFFILGEPGHQFVTDPIELLKLEVQGQHAIGMSNADVRIMDENRQEVAHFEPYTVPHEDGPPSEARLRMRDRWLENVIKFLLPPSLFQERNNPAKKRLLKTWFARHKIEISKHENGAVVVFRDGVVLTQFGV